MSDQTSSSSPPDKAPALGEPKAAASVNVDLPEGASVSVPVVLPKDWKLSAAAIRTVDEAFDTYRGVMDKIPTRY